MSNSYKVSGTIKRIEETKQITDRFRKRTFVVETQDGKYAQTIPVEATGDRCELLDDYGVGDEVEVECNVRGREVAGRDGSPRYFLSLDAWKLNRVGERKSARNPPPSAGNTGSDPDQDIPFATCSLHLEPTPIARVLR